MPVNFKEENMNKRYVIGAPAKMQELFPQYNGNDARFSLDKKQVIYEVNLSDDNLSALKKNKSIKLYTHEEILVMLNAPESAGIWFETPSSILPLIGGEGAQAPEGVK